MRLISVLFSTLSYFVKIAPQWILFRVQHKPNQGHSAFPFSPLEIGFNTNYLADFASHFMEGE